MSDKRILVTGGTGRHGGVGGFAARQLKARGAAVRALVRTRDDRSQALDALGIETVEGDMLNVASLRAAMAGVDRVLFCYPIKDGLLEAAANMCVVAREQGVRVLVDISLLPAREDSPSPEAREHWLASQMFGWAGVNPIHVMGGFFYQNLSILASETFVERGVMEMPFGDGENPLAWVSGEDVARVAVAALLDPEPYLNATLNVTGPELLSVKQVAEIATEVFGRQIEYRSEIGMNDWIARVATHPLATPRMLKHVAVLAVGLGQMKASFGSATDVVEKATGAAPQSLRAFLEDHAADFVNARQPSAAAMSG